MTSNVATVDLDMHTADVLEIEFTVKDNDGNVVDVSGASGSEISWIAQPSYTDDTDQIVKTLSSGITTPGGGTDGVVLVTLSTTDTDELKAADTLTWVHQLKVELSSKPKVVAKGELTIDQHLESVTNVDLSAEDFPVTSEYPAAVLTVT